MVRDPLAWFAGGSYYYDRDRVFWPDGGLVYSAMLDTSRSAVQPALTWVPEYAGRLHVAGDLRADDLLRHKASREAVRQRLGVETAPLWRSCRPGEPAMPFRTSGGSCYPNVLGFRPAVIMPLCSPCTGICGIPLGPARANGETWRCPVAAPGFFVIGAEDDWAELLAATDLAISDHTSLSMLYSVLGRPIIPGGRPHLSSLV